MKTTARLAGLLYLVPMLLAPFSMMYVPSVIVVAGDAAATAQNLASSTSLFRLGIAADVLVVLSEIALTAVLYVVLAPAGRALALTATFARLAMTVLQAVNVLVLLVVLQLPSSSLLLMNVHEQCVHVWELLFGLHCLTVGALVFRSGYFPRVFGGLMALAGLGYFLNGMGNVLAPEHAPLFASLVGVAAMVGEVPFVFWLLFRGLDDARYGARVGAGVGVSQ